MLYTLRLILDAEEDVIRDIALGGDRSLVDLHQAIVEVFKLHKGELASFFRSNEDWDQGEEIGLMELSLTGSDTTRTMEEFTLADLLEQKGDRLLYVYDYLHLWTFFVEVLQIEDKPAGDKLVLLASVGERPKEAPDKEMKSEEEDLFDSFEDEGAYEDDEFD